MLKSMGRGGTAGKMDAKQKMKLGKLIRQKRELAGLDQRAAAERLSELSGYHITHASWSNWERGVSAPDPFRFPAVIDALAETLHCDILAFAPFFGVTPDRGDAVAFLRRSRDEESDAEARAISDAVLDTAEAVRTWARVNNGLENARKVARILRAMRDMTPARQADVLDAFDAAVHAPYATVEALVAVLRGAGQQSDVSADGDVRRRTDSAADEESVNLARSKAADTDAVRR